MVETGCAEVGDLAMATLNQSMHQSMLLYFTMLSHAYRCLHFVSKTHRLVEAFAEYGAKAAMVSCGGQHTLILTDDGEVLSCGIGEYGLLGTGSTTDALTPSSLFSMADEEVVQIAAGHCHSLLLTVEGKVYSFGRNHMGQLGHYDSYIDIYSMEDFPRLIESEVMQGKFVTQIAAGNGRSAAITADGCLYLWGSRLSHEPVEIDRALFEGHNVVKVACGGDNSRAATAALTADGRLWTFGDSNSLMLGRNVGMTGKYPVPQLLDAFNGQVVDVIAGFGQHMVAFVEAADDGTDN